MIHRKTRENSSSKGSEEKALYTRHKNQKKHIVVAHLFH